jgi:hypothetical protein
MNITVTYYHHLIPEIGFHLKTQCNNRLILSTMTSKNSNFELRASNATRLTHVRRSIVTTEPHYLLEVSLPVDTLAPDVLSSLLKNRGGCQKC